MPLSIFRKRHEVEEIMPIPEPLEGNSSGVDHLKHLAAFEKAHKLDPNLPMDELNDVDAALATGNAEKGLEIEHALMEDNSPYPEVCIFLFHRPLGPLESYERPYDASMAPEMNDAWLASLSSFILRMGARTSWMSAIESLQSKTPDTLSNVYRSEL